MTRWAHQAAAWLLFRVARVLWALKLRGAAGRLTAAALGIGA